MQYSWFDPTVYPHVLPPPAVRLDHCMFAGNTMKLRFVVVPPPGLGLKTFTE